MKRLDLSLYGILDPKRTRGRPLPDMAEAAIKGGCSILQLRCKHAHIDEIVYHTETLLKAISKRAVPLLINDCVQAAEISGAQGVHLGQDDISVAQARDRLGKDAIIGLTVKTREEAERCPFELLDYISIGGIFNTNSKHSPTSIGIDGWRAIAQICRRKAPHLPVIAISGINVIRARALIQVGADGVAVISGLFMQDDVVTAARNYRHAIDNIVI